MIPEFPKFIKTGYNNYMWWKKRKKENISFLIVGLGNPGEKYAKTAHNCGFRIVSHLRNNEKLPYFEKDNTLNSLKSKGEVEGKKIVILLPLTFMNRSGEAARKAFQRFSPEKIIVVHDDSDLPLYTLRISVFRGSAGHKGVQSIINHLKSKEFIRLRVGIRKDDEKAKEIVLKDLSSEKREIEKKAAEELKKLISSEISSSYTVRLK